VKENHFIAGLILNTLFVHFSVKKITFFDMYYKKRELSFNDIFLGKVTYIHSYEYINVHAHTYTFMYICIIMAHARTQIFITRRWD